MAEYEVEEGDERGENLHLLEENLDERAALLAQFDGETAFQVAQPSLPSSFLLVFLIL